MDAEEYIITNFLDSLDNLSDDRRGDIRAVYDRVRGLFVGASANHNLDNFFLTRDAVNYCRAFGIANTAAVHAAKADYQTGNLWVGVYNKAIQNADLTDEEKSFLFCLKYMLRVESLYSQIVDKVCYLLVRQTKPPGSILGKNKHCCKHVETVDAISARRTLATKLEFLANNGFVDLADACDRDLRNAAAHMTAIIGEPKINSERRSGTAYGVKTKFSIEGADIRIRRHVRGADMWEKVDMDKADYRLEMAVWSYMTAFSLCYTVQFFTTDPMFMRALNNPDDPHYEITFSNGDVGVKWCAPNKDN